MNDSIFTQIIKGELSAHKIYEDQHTLALMDIHPVQPGMVLVVSKQQIGNFYELDDEAYKALWQTVKLVAKKQREVFPDKLRIGVQIEGMEVDHVHVKVFPINSGEDFRMQPNLTSEPDHAALSAMAERLKISASLA